MKIRVHYIFPEVQEISGHELTIETDDGLILVVKRQNILEPRLYTKEFVQTIIDGEKVSALVEWLP